LNRAKLILLLIFAFSLKGSANAQYFSPDAEISLVTCSPGSELYSIFGHSAIRVKDTTTDTDLIFNYGVFDFDTPNFYWKFIRGKLQYKLAIQPTGWFVESYAAEGRMVKVEKMNLTRNEKNRMIRFLRVNYLPENRYYLYDFFYNNCSTKIWDVAEENIPGELTFDTSIYDPQSFRNLLAPYLSSVPWAKLGIDLLLGMPADKIATFKQQMYLPDFLSRNMSHTIRKEAVGGKRGLLGPEKVILERDPQKSQFNKPFIGPLAAFSLLLGLVLVITFFGGQKVKRWVDALLLLMPGLLGILLLFMWFGSDHQQMDWNLNVIWANPVALVFVFFALRNKMRSAAIAYGIWLVFLVINLIGWHWIPQDFHPALFPLIVAWVVRGADRFVPICCPRYAWGRTVGMPGQRLKQEDAR
jgi:hypothetical protein